MNNANAIKPVNRPLRIRHRIVDCELLQVFIHQPHQLNHRPPHLHLFPIRSVEYAAQPTGLAGLPGGGWLRLRLDANAFVHPDDPRHPRHKEPGAA